MLRYFIIINASLIILILLLGFNLFRSWSVKEPPSKNQSKIESITQDSIISEETSVEPAKEQYNIIPKQDLFSDSRTEVIEEPAKPPAPQKPPQNPPPKPQLKGIAVIGEGRRLALLKSAIPDEKRNNQLVLDSTKPYQEGQKIGDYTVFKIQEDRVILKWQDQETVILLSDQKKEDESRKSQVSIAMTDLGFIPFV